MKLERGLIILHEDATQQHDNIIIMEDSDPQDRMCT